MEPYLHSTNLTNKFRIGVNPFTDEEIQFPLDDGLSELQLTSTKKYLNSIGAYPAEDDTYVYIPIKSRETLRLGAAGLLRDANPACYSLEWDFISLQVADVLFNLCVNSGMVFWYEIDSVLNFSNTNIDLVHRRWRNVSDTQSAKRLHEWLIEKYYD